APGGSWSQRQLKQSLHPELSLGIRGDPHSPTAKERLEGCARVVRRVCKSRPELLGSLEHPRAEGIEIEPRGRCAEPCLNARPLALKLRIETGRLFHVARLGCEPCQVAEFGLDLAKTGSVRAWIVAGHFVADELEGPLHRVEHDLGHQDPLTHGPKNARFEFTATDSQRVPAHVGPAIAMPAAAVPLSASHGKEAPTAYAALEKTRQQVAARAPSGAALEKRAVVSTLVGALLRGRSLSRSVPQRGGNDRELGDGLADPFGLGPLVAAPAPRVVVLDPLASVPDVFPAIYRVLQHRLQCGRRPSLGSRRRGTLGVEPARDRAKPLPHRVELEDLPYNKRFSLMNHDAVPGRDAAS